MNFKRGLCRLGIHARTSRSCARCKCRMDSASQARGVCAGETPGPGSAAPKFAPTCQLWRSASCAESACTVCGTQLAARCVYINSESSSPPQRCCCIQALRKAHGHSQPRPALPYPGLFHRPIYFPTFSLPPPKLCSTVQLAQSRPMPPAHHPL